MPVIGEKMLREITPADITVILNRRERAGGKSTSVMNLYGLLSGMFETAHQYELIEGSPVKSRLHRPTLKTEEKPILTAEQIRRVIKETPEAYKPMFLCMALLALRIGEVLGLRWQDIDFDAGRLNIAHTLWRKDLSEPKTKRSKGSIHIPGALMSVLMIYRHQSLNTEPDDFVFARADGSPYNAASYKA